ncbi:Ldh family oxidoreductase [Seohaeicola nanhaiensis]|uniref:Ldh family oxidoreductase n=1 Tax=Seohaeicola nanhaiensis TaxID=1387282 RepID=A0ABV9KP95_9RHOB
MIAAVEAIARLGAALGGDPAAELAAAALVEADVLGQPRFGIAMLDEWRPDAQPLPKETEPRAVRWVDASACFAPVAVAGATLDLGLAAHQFGVAAVFLRGVRGFGRLAPFVRHLADDGLVGLAGAQSAPFVAPFGGTGPAIGTNPLALAMGTGAERVVIDLATASITIAELRKARAEGTPLPEGAGLDAAGQPTTTAAEVAALLPRDGKAGSLLGLVVELLAGVAGGGRGDPAGRGVFLLAFDPAAAEGDIGWRDRLAALQGDWTGGGGHWPKGGGLPEGATLDAGFAERLDAFLARMA